MGLGGSVDRDFNKCGKTGKGVPGEKILWVIGENFIKKVST